MGAGKAGGCVVWAKRGQGGRGGGQQEIPSAQAGFEMNWKLQPLPKVAEGSLQLMWKGNGSPELAWTTGRSPSMCPRTKEGGSREKASAWVFLKTRQNPPDCFTQSSLLHPPCCPHGCLWVPGLPASKALGQQAGTAPGQAWAQLWLWVVVGWELLLDGNRRLSFSFPWILFSTPRLKISPQGRMKRKLCGRLCCVSSWLFPYKWAVGPSVS